ncbi:hypothetical protein FKM82_027485 [Ascaphus truei]
MTKAWVSQKSNVIPVDYINPFAARTGLPCIAWQWLGEASWAIDAAFLAITVTHGVWRSTLPRGGVNKVRERRINANHAQSPG